MATKTAQLHDVAAQSESVNDALELAQQGTVVAHAARGNLDAATTETNSRPTPRDDRSLNALREQWRSLQLESLALRWQIGALCNETLGGPTASQTLKNVANEIG